MEQMNTVKLLDVTKENLLEIVKLSETMTPEQQKCVSSNAYSIAQAHYNKDRAWFKAIYAHEKPVGFIMVDIKLNEDELTEEEKPSVMLWRFMIGGAYQGKGYGKKALDLIVEKFREAGNKYLFTSCYLREGTPYPFYIKYGFEDIHEKNGEEKILKLKL